MTIAVHISVPDIEKDLSSNFIYKCFTILAASHPANHYIFIFDKPFSPALITEKNITPVLSGPQIKNRLLEYYFYNFKIPRLLNKYNADLFVSAEVCSLRSNVPQCFIIKDLSFLKKNNLFSKTDTRYLKKYTALFIKRSERIAVLNPFLKKTLAASYSVYESKINTLAIAVNDVFKKTDYEKGEAIRNAHTDGKEYFLFFATASAEANIITMLKAFSIFKKWQKSGMHLLMLFPAGKTPVIKDFSNYKYRRDVKLLSSVPGDMSAGLIAAAYAAIHLPSMEITETEGLNVLASAVPLITTDSDFYNCLYKDGALYSAQAEKDLSEKMMLLYKDENSRNELIEKGTTVAAAHTWQHAADSLFQAIT